MDRTRRCPRAIGRLARPCHRKYRRRPTDTRLVCSRTGRPRTSGYTCVNSSSLRPRRSAGDRCGAVDLCERPRGGLSKSNAGRHLCPDGRWRTRSRLAGSRRPAGHGVATGGCGRGKRVGCPGGRQAQPPARPASHGWPDPAGPDAVGAARLPRLRQPLAPISSAASSDGARVPRIRSEAVTRGPR
jgi:hypothetical protein